MVLIKKYCGCILKTNGFTMLTCKRPGHSGNQPFTLNGFDSWIIKKNQINPEEAAEIMKKAFLNKGAFK